MTCKKTYILLLLDHQVVNLLGGRFLLAALLHESRSDVDLVRNDSLISAHLQLSLLDANAHIPWAEDWRSELLE